MIYKPKPKGESNRELAQKIAVAIKASPLKNKEVAQQCGVKPQAVTGWKTTGRISKEMLSVLAGVVGVPLGHFMDAAPKARASKPEKEVKIDILPVL